MDDCFRAINKFNKDIKKSYMKHYVDMIVDEFLAYRKHLNIEGINYLHIVHTANEEITLTNKEFNKVISLSKKTLKNRHGIEIINDNPIMIKTGAHEE